MSKTMALGLGLTLVVACSAANEPQTSEVSEALGKTDCALVLCALPVCELDQALETRPGQCCPVCVDARPRVRAGDCACTGGYMDASYCDQFGAPWSWNNWACFWSGKGGSGLTQEECAAVEAKHQGDGSGSDIYNLGLSCIYGASDCRTKGCPSGEHCDVCKTIEGAAYVCLPDGSVC
jgi:hypothetical protein